MPSLRSGPSRMLAMIGLLMLMVTRLAGATGESPDFLINLWTSDNNLPDDGVTSLAQTRDGYLWIGTYNGLVRFDGEQFVTFDPANTPELKHARVTNLLTDTDGTLWINTYDGFLTSLRNGVFAREWHTGPVSAVFCKSNQTYFATLSGGVIARTENVSGQAVWQTIQLSRRNEAMCFCQDAAGTIWYMLRDGKLGRIADTNATLLPFEKELGNDRISCLATDHRGRVWVGTPTKIARWDGAHFVDETPTNGEPTVDTTFLFFTRTNGFWAIANGTVRHAMSRQWVAEMKSWSSFAQAFVFERDAYEERNGDVWFRELGHGLFYADAKGNSGRICATNGLPSNRVTCWLQDREGNIWAGMDRGGLVRLQKRLFQTVGGETQQNLAVSTVCEDLNSNIWIGTVGGGLIRWKDGQSDHFNLAQGANRDSFYSACPDRRGLVWLSADREDLYVWETNKIISTTNGIHGIKSVFVDQKNQIWLGRLSGLTRITNGVYSNYGQWNGFERREVRTLAEDAQGALWLGTGNGIIYKFSNGSFAAFKPDDALEDQAVWSLLPDDDGTIWAGTFRGGLLRFKEGKFTRYTTANGLPSNIICQILDDGMGRLWFGSHKGIFFVPKSSFTEFDEGKITSLPCTSYGLNDGLPTLECSGGYTPSCWKGRDGKLWFATGKGVVFVNPAQVRLNSLAPPVVIEGFLLDGKNYRDTGTNRIFETALVPPAAGLATNSIISIPPGRHQLDLLFTALSFAAPDQVRFRYQLSSFDNGWVEAGAKRSAHYGPLPPGHYTFQVLACNDAGVWNKSGASLAIIQLPFFWQTWWFDCLAATALIVIVATAVRLVTARNLQKKLEHLKQQRALERERERIAKDIHDELGAGLTQILLQSSLARRESQGQTRADLTQISETARDLVSTMDEIVWAITPENDTLDGLVTYIGKFVQEFCGVAKVRCRLNLPPQPPAIAVSAETRHHLFLAIKESLNNVVKHAHAAEVFFALRLQPDAFTFVIKDNGIGFNATEGAFRAVSPERIASGHGLRNLAKRLNEIGGRCVITSLPGEGTVIELTVPVNNHSTANSK